MPDDVEWEDSIWMQIIPPFDRRVKSSLKALTHMESDSGETPKDFLERVIDAALGWGPAPEVDAYVKMFLSVLTKDLQERVDKEATHGADLGEVYLVYTADGDGIFIRGDTSLSLIADCGLSFSWPPSYPKDAVTLSPLPDPA